MKNSNENILVLGGSGKNGRRVVKKLRQRGFTVFSASRGKNAGTPSDRFFDWDDEGSYEAALKDVHRVYIVHPDTSMPTALGQIAALIDKMVKLPVSKVVLLSGRGQESVHKCENVLVNSSLNWTIVRSAWFFQNFSEGHFLGGIKSGEVRFMANENKEPFVDLDDLTDVVAEAVSSDAHNGKFYEVTGDVFYRFKDVVEIIGKHLNKDIKYTFLGQEEYKSLLIAKGINASVAEHMVWSFSEILDGRNANFGTGVQQVLGRKPQKLVDFVHANQFE